MRWSALKITSDLKFHFSHAFHQNFESEGTFLRSTESAAGKNLSNWSIIRKHTNRYQCKTKMKLSQPTYFPFWVLAPTRWGTWLCRTARWPTSLAVARPLGGASAVSSWQLRKRPVAEALLELWKRHRHGRHLRWMAQHLRHHCKRTSVLNTLPWS